jgi:toxin FitB
MTILDTNVVGELLKPQPAREVQTWFRSQPAILVLTTISIAEIQFGIEKLPEGRKKRELEHEFRGFVEEDLMPGSILSFDEYAAARYGALLAESERNGILMATMDAMIAAIALTQLFAHTGLRIVNPWAP